MAARKNRGATPGSMCEEWKNKIRAGVLTDRLMQCVEGKVEMTSIQVKAADILLRKVAPDLARSEVTGAGGKDLIPKDIRIELVDAPPTSQGV